MSARIKTLDEFKSEVIAAFPAFKDAEFGGLDGSSSAYLGAGFIQYRAWRPARYRWTVGAFGMAESATLRGAATKYKRSLNGALEFLSAIGAKP